MLWSVSASSFSCVLVSCMPCLLSCLGELSLVRTCSLGAEV
jgi:hypothetical protein